PFFGLGGADSVRLYDSTGALFESYSWTAHATTTYGRCPNGIGAITTTTSSTKGTANDCSTPLKITEVESSGGVPRDWVELKNPTAAAINVSGFTLKDNDDLHSYVIPSVTMIPANGYLVLNQADFGFDLDASDSVRIFDVFGALADSF